MVTELYDVLFSMLTIEKSSIGSCHFHPKHPYKFFSKNIYVYRVFVR